jgi:hypothetical protein
MGVEFINNVNRYCLWISDDTLDDALSIPEIKQRINAVRKIRSKSTREATNKLSEIPHLFGEIRQPLSGNYLALPHVSSENRLYIPVGFLPHSHIAGNHLYTIPNATLYHFGIVTSSMHNDWMRVTSGRIKSDYQYSVSLTFNTFPWVEASESDKEEVETLAQLVLSTRSQYPDKSLAWLYNTSTMPIALKNAHIKLDKCVDKLYGLSASKITASDRIQALFSLYQSLTKQLV